MIETLTYIRGVGVVLRARPYWGLFDFDDMVESMYSGGDNC
jgi:hypothetical protein